MATALVQLDTGNPGDASCRGFSTLSGSAVCQVVVTASLGSATAAADARDLHGQILLAMMRQHSRRGPTHCHGALPFGAAGCWAGRHPGPVRRTLVWVVDPACAPPAVPLATGPGHPWTTVLPIIPWGVTPAGLPAQARMSVTRSYSPGLIAAAVPDVLAASGLGTDGFRIFISYRQDDARTFADQLFDGLSHEGFDVYLDRFRTMPGTNFVERIRSELIDKACVVLLDTRDVRRSRWVEGEYGVARFYRLGLMAIDLPGGLRSFPRIGARLDLRRRGKRGIPFTGAEEMPAPAVADAVEFVRETYHSEVARRFRHQRMLLRNAAALAGVAITLRPDGLVEVNGARRYVLCASARPPGSEEFRSACEAVGGRAGGKGVVVGPLAAQTHHSRTTATWLANAVGAAAVDEARLYKALRRAAAGRL